MKPTYFDLSVLNVQQAKSFFEAVLGWRFEKFDMPYEYFRIEAGRHRAWHRRRHWRSERRSAGWRNAHDPSHGGGQRPR
jgi:catechol 2,3-dioxygenase-like lactoylglutathione lyase family enzyme